MAQSTQDRTVKHYEVNEQIGIGGMGTVYRGTDPNSGESVAIKILASRGSRQRTRCC